MATTTTQRYSFAACNTTFIINTEYEFVVELGQDDYGSAVAARHKRSGEECEIKKIIVDINTKSNLTKRCLREIKCVSCMPKYASKGTMQLMVTCRTLRHFRGHKNISCLYDMDVVFRPSGICDAVYFYEERMEADLHTIIRSGQPLTDLHFQRILYQMLCGLKYIHSAGVLHRDIKPGNLLMNADCDLKICNFGLAQRHTPGGPKLPEDVVASESVNIAGRWYRAPEIMLSYAGHTTAFDVWSVGCVFSELLGGIPIFRGKDFMDQVVQILGYLGTPSEDTLSRVITPRAKAFIESLPIRPRVPFATLYPHANPRAIDLLSLMLCFDPAKRISCEKALNHPYLEDWHDPVDEPACEAKFDFSFEEEHSIDGMIKLIIEEVSLFRAEVRGQARAPGQSCRQDSLPIPSRDEIQSLPTHEYRDVLGATSGCMVPTHGPQTPVMDDPSDGLDWRLANAPTGTDRSLDQSSDSYSLQQNTDGPPPNAPARTAQMVPPQGVSDLTTS